MKIKLLTATMAFILVGFTAKAQEALKIGYANPEYILSLMPDTKQIESDLGTYQKQLATQLKSKDDEFKAKYQAYAQGAESMTEVIRKDKENELKSLQENIQKFSQNAEVEFQKKQVQLLKPVLEKIGKTIEQVALENGYTHVFNMGTNGVDVLLYAREQDNITNLVLKKLGITPPAASNN